MGLFGKDPNPKDDAEKLKQAARKKQITRPWRTYCAACNEDFGTPLSLLNHIKKAHPAK